MNSAMKSFAGAVLAALLGCVCAAAQASAPPPAPERPADSAPLRVGVSPVFPPMVFKQGKELAGAEVDLARAFGQRLGRKVAFVEVPWEDQIEALRSGKIDIVMSSMSITTARRSVVDFSKPYLVIGQMALVRRENQNDYILGFPTKPGTIGVIKATTGDFQAQRDFPKAPRKVFKTDSDAVSALKKKKIDLFISDSTTIWYLAGIHSADGLAPVPVALSEEPLAWAVRKGDARLLAAADDFIQKASEDGTLKQVFRRWMAVSP
jgi:polar amino acid transport system substrate-binding protein